MQKDPPEQEPQVEGCHRHGTLHVEVAMWGLLPVLIAEQELVLNRSFVVEQCKDCWHHSHSNHGDFVDLTTYDRVMLADRLLGKRSSEQHPIGSTPG